MIATLTRRPTTRPASQTTAARPVPEMLREIAFLLHATRVVKRLPPVLKPR